MIKKKSREVTRFPAIFNVLAIIGYDPEARVIAIQRMLRSIFILHTFDNYNKAKGY